MKTRVSLFLSTLLISCATQSPLPPISSDTLTDIVWPAPPTTARIRYLYSFRGPEDLGQKESFSNRMKDLFAGSDKHNMTRPYAIAVHGQLTAVVDPGQGAVHLFNTRRKHYEQLTTIGGQFLISPIGVALGKDRIYVSDSALNRVFVLDYKRRLLAELSGFQRATELAYEPVSQRLYVADTHAHRILVYDREGTPVSTFGERGDGNGQFNYPTHLAVTDKRLYVTDTMNFRVQIFDLDGEHINTFGIHGDGPGYFAQPKGIGVNSDGHIFVVEAVASRIQIFSPDGEFLMSFGYDGKEQAAFQLPTGIAVVDDKIFVVDSGNRRVQVFQYLGEK